MIMWIFLARATGVDGAAGRSLCCAPADTTARPLRASLAPATTATIVQGFAPR
jgi:hypothetical protein